MSTDTPTSRQQLPRLSSKAGAQIYGLKAWYTQRDDLPYEPVEYVCVCVCVEERNM